MISLIYVSTASHTMDAAEIAGLGTQASHNNVRCGVTGMLVHDGERFMQLLEGADRVVLATFARIKSDPRHGEIEVIRLEQGDERECPDWSMRALTMPLTESGSADEFAESLPEDMAADTRALFTSFAAAALKSDA